MMERKRFTLDVPWPNFSKVRLTRLLPTPGNVIFTLVMIALLVLAQSAGALPLANPKPVLSPVEVSAIQNSQSTIAYQGRLADANGTPLTNTVNMYLI